MAEGRAEAARQVVKPGDAPAVPTVSAADSVRTEWDARSQPCPVCGHPMPDLKGGKASICEVCGFKDSCCY